MLILTFLLMLLIHDNTTETTERQIKKLQILPIIDTSYQELQLPQQRRKQLEESTPKYKKQTTLHEDLSNENLDNKWLLMVESGKIDEEEMKKITPKSVFIAPILSNRSCKSGYRFDHLGNCIKVIRLDEAAQLDFLLKKLMQLNGKELQEEAIPPSSGPLQFSIPIEEDTTEPVENATEIINTSVVESKVNYSVSLQTADKVLNVPIEEYSGFGESENSGVGPIDDKMSELKQAESFDATNESVTLESVTEIESTTFEESSGQNETLEEDFLPVTNTTTQFVSVDVSTQVQTNDTVVVNKRNDSGVVVEKQNVSYIRFPAETAMPQNTVRFPENKNQSNFRFDPHSSSKFIDAKPNEPSSYFSFDTHADVVSQNYKVDPTSVSKNQYWWLQDGWDVDKEKQNPPLINFWSKVPLVRDISLIDSDKTVDTVSYEYGMSKDWKPYVSNPVYNQENYKTNRRFVSFQSNEDNRGFTNPWMKYTNHERQGTAEQVQDRRYRPIFYFRKTLKS